MMLTRKQQDYYIFWSKTGFDPSRRRECMTAAGYSELTPCSHLDGSRKLRRKIERAMDQAGLTPRAVCDKLAEKMECVVPRSNYPDNTNQLKAVDMVCRLGDFYPSQKVDINKREETIRLDMRTIRLAEEISGEKIVDAEVVEEETVAALGVGPDEAL